MKKIYTLLSVMAVSSLIFISCKKDSPEEIVSGVTNLQFEELPGEIKITWEKEEPVTFDYLKITYYDKLKKKQMLRLASSHSSEIIIPNTRKKYGEYEFRIQPVGAHGTEGQEYILKATSGAAPSRIASTVDTKLELATSNLYSNEPETSEGSLANLLDGNDATFFHSRWKNNGGRTTHTHYLQINLDTPIKDGIKFSYSGRNNGNNYPTQIVVSASTDGGTWEELADLSNGLPNPSTGVGKYDSEILWFLGKGYKHFKFDVIRTESNDRFFVMSEFKMWQVTPIIEDPEAPANGD